MSPTPKPKDVVVIDLTHEDQPREERYYHDREDYDCDNDNANTPSEESGDCDGECESMPQDQDEHYDDFPPGPIKAPLETWVIKELVEAYPNVDDADDDIKQILIEFRSYILSSMKEPVKEIVDARPQNKRLVLFYEAVVYRDLHEMGRLFDKYSSIRDAFKSVLTGWHIRKVFKYETDKWVFRDEIRVDELKQKCTQ